MAGTNIPFAATFINVLASRLLVGVLGFPKFLDVQPAQVVLLRPPVVDKCFVAFWARMPIVPHPPTDFVDLSFESVGSKYYSCLWKHSVPKVMLDWGEPRMNFDTKSPKQVLIKLLKFWIRQVFWDLMFLEVHSMLKKPLYKKVQYIVLRFLFEAVQSGPVITRNNSIPKSCWIEWV